MTNPGCVPSSICATRTTHVAEKSLKNAKVRIARRSKSNALVFERHRSVDGQLRIVAGQLQILNAHDVLIERQANRPCVVNGVIEQRDVQRVDGAFDQ